MSDTFDDVVGILVDTLVASPFYLQAVNPTRLCL